MMTVDLGLVHLENMYRWGTSALSRLALALATYLTLVLKGVRRSSNGSIQTFASISRQQAPPLLAQRRCPQKQMIVADPKPAVL
jgi:hypothetical protein